MYEYIVEQDGGCKVIPFVVERSCFFHYDMIESTRNWFKKKKQKPKNDTNELTKQREAQHRERKQTHGCQEKGQLRT